MKAFTAAKVRKRDLILLGGHDYAVRTAFSCGRWLPTHVSVFSAHEQVNCSKKRSSFQFYIYTLKLLLTDKFKQVSSDWCRLQGWAVK